MITLNVGRFDAACVGAYRSTLYVTRSKVPPYPLGAKLHERAFRMLDLCTGIARIIGNPGPRWDAREAAGERVQRAEAWTA